MTLTTVDAMEVYTNCCSRFYSILVKETFCRILQIESCELPGINDVVDPCERSRNDAYQQLLTGDSSTEVSRQRTGMQKHYVPLNSTTMLIFRGAI